MKQSFPGTLSKVLKIFIPLLIGLVGIYSLYMALSSTLTGDQEAFIILPDQAYCGSPLPVRIYVRHHGIPVKDAHITGTLLAHRQKTVLFEGRTDARGAFYSAREPSPETAKGPVKLLVSIRSPWGKEEFRRPLTLRQPVHLALSTDRNHYRPGDTVYIKASARDINRGTPAASQEVALAVREPGGIVIFKKEGITQAYGSFTAAFKLAEALQEGPYRVTVKTARDMKEKTITVASDTAPSFLIDITTDRSFYRPGELMKGAVTVKDPDGEPAENASVSLLLCVHTEEGTFSLEPIKGKTLKGGDFPFSSALPAAFPPSLPCGDRTSITINATVENQNGCREIREKICAVSEKSADLSWVPCGLGLVPGFSSVSYFISHHPDGTPAPATLTVKTMIREVTLKTDSSGIAPFTCDPAKDGKTFRITVKPFSGGQEILDLTPPLNPISFCAMTERVTYRAGETLEVDIASLQKSGTLILSLISADHTVLSRTVALQGSLCHDRFTLPDSLSGHACLQFTRINNDGTFEKDYQPLYIKAPEALKVVIASAGKTFEPSQDALFSILCTKPGASQGTAAFEAALYELSPGNLPRGFRYVSDDSPDEEEPSRIIKIPEHLIFSVQQALGEAEQQESFQQKARIALFPEIYHYTKDLVTINLYSHKKKQINEHKDRYFQKLFIYSFRALLLLICACFLAIAALTLYHGYLKRKEEKRFLLFRSGDDVLSLLIFIIGFFVLIIAPMMFILLFSFFSSLEPAEMSNHPLFKIFLALEIFLMFIYLIALWKNVRVRPIRKMLTLKYTFFALQCYIGASIVLISLLFTTSLNRWDIDLIMSPNMSYVHLVLFTLCAMPFLLIYTTVSHITKPKKSPGRTRLFYASSATIILAIIAATFLIFHYSAQENHRGNSSHRAAAVPLQNKGAQEEQNMPDPVLYIPQALTSPGGAAILSVPMPAETGSYRLCVNALTEEGDRGSRTSDVSAFRDFSLHYDIPSRVTKGDRLSIPVLVRNISKKTENLAFSFASDRAGSRGYSTELFLDAGQSRVISVPFTAEEEGVFHYAVTASTAQSKYRAEKEITVEPRGGYYLQSRSGWIRNDVTIPPCADNCPARISIYPTLTSVLSDTAEILSHPPQASFEEITSSAYAYTLLLDKLNGSASHDRTLKARVEQAVNEGYQQMVSFEYRGGGFVTFIRKEASDMTPSLWNTAYGLSCLAHMAKVQPVDPDLLHRTIHWIMSQQKSDGSWEHNPRTTAFVALSLIDGAKTDSRAVQRALDYMKKNLRKDTDTNTLALCSLAFISRYGDSSIARQFAEKVKNSAIVSGTKAFWGTGLKVPSKMDPSDSATTALCIQVLARTHLHDDLREKALEFLMESRNCFGGWSSSWTSIESLKALAATEPEGEQKGIVSIMRNNRTIRSISIDPAGSDSPVVIEIEKPGGEGNLQLCSRGNIHPSYLFIQKHAEQISADQTHKHRLLFNVAYDRQRASVRSMVRARISVRNSGERDTEMLILTFPTPPGLQIIREDLEKLIARKKALACSYSDGTAYIYIKGIKKNDTLSFNIPMKALFPAQIETPKASVCEYYYPENQYMAPPSSLTLY